METMGILIIDDDLRVQHALGSALVPAYVVHFASSGFVPTSCCST